VATRVVATASQAGFGLGLVVTAFIFGLRHGLDWDHIAAISDITGAQETPRRSLFYSTLYALGHGSMVLILGSIAILGGDRLPTAIDAVMEPVVGATLLALGAYVVYSLLRHGRDFRMRSRWMLVFEGMRRLTHRQRTKYKRESVEHEHEHPSSSSHGHIHSTIQDGARPAGSGSLLVGTHAHRHRHVAPLPQDPFVNYGKATSFGVGMLHGVGAETPTQVLLFLAAVGAGGRATGVALLLTFLVGLFATNTAVAIASAYGFLRAEKSWPVYATIATLTAAFSLALGTLYLLGQGNLLPALL
jgi:ABC-type nickel/cobalt efflux system permease component RcnA